MDCSGRHRSYGPQISFVRSTNMDNWTEEQLLKMELGGNKKFKQFLKEKGIKEANYKSDELITYKRELDKKVLDKIPRKDNER